MHFISIVDNRTLLPIDVNPSQLEAFLENLQHVSFLSLKADSWVPTSGP